VIAHQAIRKEKNHGLEKSDQEAQQGQESAAGEESRFQRLHQDLMKLNNCGQLAVLVFENGFE
jgi:hypothetical protein